MKRLSRKWHNLMLTLLQMPIMPIFAKGVSGTGSQHLQEIEEAGGIVLWTESGKDGIVLAVSCPECHGDPEYLPSRGRYRARCATCEDRGTVITEKGESLTRFDGDYLYRNPHPLVG
jgi:hypothetical protein